MYEKYIGQSGRVFLILLGHEGRGSRRGFSGRFEL